MHNHPGENYSASNSKKKEESSTLKITCIEKSSKMWLRHEEGEVMISLMARSRTLELSNQVSIILHNLDLEEEMVILISLKVNGLNPVYVSAIPLIVAA